MKIHRKGFSCYYFRHYLATMILIKTLKALISLLLEQNWNRCSIWQSFHFPPNWALIFSELANSFKLIKPFGIPVLTSIAEIPSKVSEIDRRIRHGIFRLVLLQRPRPSVHWTVMSALAANGKRAKGGLFKRSQWQDSDDINSQWERSFSDVSTTKIDGWVTYKALPCWPVWIIRRLPLGWFTNGCSVCVRVPFFFVVVCLIKAENNRWLLQGWLPKRVAHDWWTWISTVTVMEVSLRLHKIQLSCRHRPKKTYARDWLWT